MIKKLLYITCFPLLLSASENYLSLKYGLTSLNNDGIDLNDNSFLFDLRVDGEYEIYPRIGFSYVDISEKGESVTGLIQGFVEGGYDLKVSPDFTPYLFGGIGYENVINSRKGFDSQFFIDAGAGVRVPINQDFNFLSELKSLYMLGGNNQDSELALYLGFDYSLHPQTTLSEPISYQAQTPQIDSDGDGVSDDIDKCPNTALGIGVDLNGCPVVSEVIAPEPAVIEAPKPIKTEDHIIVKDSDGDGIEDRLDKCPHTPKGFSVTSSGCPIKKNLNIHFEPNSSTIPFSQKPKISAFADYIKRYPNARIKIVGYTDTSGDYEKNLEISRRRAMSVKKLLIQYGVDASKIKALGKGELNPIAPNDTPEGREKNRRIEVEIY